jgi:hypothetical protein
MLKTLLVNLLLGQSKLATTWRPDDLRDFGARKQLHKSIGILDRGGMSAVFWSLAEIASGLEFRGTAYTPCAAQVDVTGLLDEV